MKHCTKCDRVKPLSAFALHSRDGYQNWCRTCMNKESTRSRQQPDKRRARSAQEHKRISMKVYNITSEQYDTIMRDRTCQVCGGTTRITLDHDHLTGLPRGVLCQKCNIALGHMQDNAVNIRRLADYLEGVL